MASKRTHQESEDDDTTFESKLDDILSKSFRKASNSVVSQAIMNMHILDGNKIQSFKSSSSIVPTLYFDLKLHEKTDMMKNVTASELWTTATTRAKVSLDPTINPLDKKIENLLLQVKYLLIKKGVEDDDILITTTDKKKSE